MQHHPILDLRARRTGTPSLAATAPRVLGGVGGDGWPQSAWLSYSARVFFWYSVPRRQARGPSQTPRYRYSIYCIPRSWRDCAPRFWRGRPIRSRCAPVAACTPASRPLWRTHPGGPRSWWAPASTMNPSGCGAASGCRAQAPGLSSIVWNGQAPAVAGYPGGPDRRRVGRLYDHLQLAARRHPH